MIRIISFFLFCILLVSFFIIQFHARENDYIQDDEQKGLNNQLVLKFSHVVAENTPKGLAAQRFAQLVQEKTNNAVKVEVYPNGILYSDEEEFEALKQGSIQMIAPASSKLTMYFPELYIMDLPFAFPNDEVLEKALNGEIGKTLLSKLNTDKVMGVSLWRNGFKQMTSNEGPLLAPEDFYGQHFRIMPSKVIEDQFRTFFVRTKKIPFNQTYKSLLDGTITGQENTLSNIYSKKFYEVQKYLTLSDHGVLSYVVLMNKNFWNTLDHTQQTAIMEAMEEANAYNRRLGKEMNAQALQNIQNHSSIKIDVLSPEAKLRWLEKMDPVYDTYTPIIGADLMEMLRQLQQENPIGMRSTP